MSEILTKQELLEIRKNIPPLSNVTRRPKNDRGDWRKIENIKDELNLKKELNYLEYSTC